MKALWIVLFTIFVLVALSGCSVNVVVAPHATFAVESNFDSEHKGGE